MHDEKNKEELFKFLSVKIMSFKYPDNKEVFVTDGPFVLTNSTTQAMPQCDHEEADTRLVVHIADALKKGLSTCLVCTVDTDVIVILIGKFPYLTAVNSDANIWVAFGVGKNFVFWYINTICSNLGEAKSITLPFFHSFTGCDITSGFLEEAKRWLRKLGRVFQKLQQYFPR